MANDMAPRRRGKDKRHRKSCKARQHLNTLCNHVCSMPAELYNMVLGFVCEYDLHDIFKHGNRVDVLYDHDPPIDLHLFGPSFARLYYSQMSFVVLGDGALPQWLSCVTDTELTYIKNIRVIVFRTERDAPTYATEMPQPLYTNSTIILEQDYAPFYDDSWFKSLLQDLKRKEGISLQKGVLKCAFEEYDQQEEDNCDHIRKRSHCCSKWRHLEGAMNFEKLWSFERISTPW